MKFATPVLLVSLAANVALAAFVYRHHLAGPKPADGSVRSAASAHASKPPPAAGASVRSADASGDIAALEAAGFTPEIAREIVLGRAFARFAEKLKAARAAQSGDDRWWRNRNMLASRTEESQARRELSAALIAAFGDDFGLSGGGDASLSFLSPEKRAALRQITQDYDEMMAKFSASGLQLASDREKLSLLRAERQRDIAGLLTPAELAEYEMRTSNTAAMLRARFGDAIANEDDFRKLYTLQKAFDERYPMPNGRVTPESMRERSAAQRQLQSDMRAALGEPAYAALTRAADSDLRNVDALASRLNLPASTTDQVAAVRDNFAAESQRISFDGSLNPQQRRAQIQELVNRAKSSLASALGSEAADAYVQRSPWLNMLQNGMAYSTTPPADSMLGMMPGGPAVYPVMPPGGPGGQATAAVRQVVNLGTGDPAAGPAAPAGDMFFYSVATPAIEPGKVVGFDAAGVATDVKLNAATGTSGGMIITAPVAPAGTALPGAIAPAAPAAPANALPLTAPQR